MSIDIPADPALAFEIIAAIATAAVVLLLWWSSR